MFLRVLAVGMLLLATTDLVRAQETTPSKTDRAPSIIEWKEHDVNAQAVFLVNPSEAWKWDIPMKVATNVLLLANLMVLLTIRSELAEKKPGSL